MYVWKFLCRNLELNYYDRQGTTIGIGNHMNSSAIWEIIA